MVRGNRPLTVVEWPPVINVDWRQICK